MNVSIIYDSIEKKTRGNYVVLNRTRAELIEEALKMLTSDLYEANPTEFYNILSTLPNCRVFENTCLKDLAAYGKNPNENTAFFDSQRLNEIQSFSKLKIIEKAKLIESALRKDLTLAAESTEVSDANFGSFYAKLLLCRIPEISRLEDWNCEIFNIFAKEIFKLDKLNIKRFEDYDVIIYGNIRNLTWRTMVDYLKFKLGLPCNEWSIRSFDCNNISCPSDILGKPLSLLESLWDKIYYTNLVH